jgi:molecular chaperone IbpA
MTVYANSLFIGFEDVLDRLTKLHEAGSKQITGYPPYDIAKLDDNRYVISLAIAGFTENDLDIQLEQNVLKISGNVETTQPKRYIHRGIADRAFTRQFTLADDVEIKSASLDNGMLSVYLEQIIPEHKKPRKIEIGSKPPTKQLLTE